MLPKSAYAKGDPVTEPPPLPDGAVAAVPRTGFAWLVQDNDYPPEALRKNAQGSVGFEVWVSAKGRAEACIVTQTSGSRALDDATCRIVSTRARFKPARGAAGEPLRDRVRSSLGWYLERPGAR
ncbi:energy transducer TonB [Sphingosinicella sp. BN140058]|nr:energy transducer TonB [Sphingosinicella sp. BN140058]